MPKPFFNEEMVEVDGETLHLVLNFRAIDCIESLTGQTMNTIIGGAIGGDMPLSLSVKVLWGLLREKHEDLSLDDASGYAFGDDSGKIGMAVSELLSRGFNFGDGKKKVKAASGA